MGFFDLNIPYLDLSSSSSSPENTTFRNNRLKIVLKAMELGYTGVAYNRSIKGVMSDKDICSISHFPLPSLLKLSPNLFTSIQFHRKLLGIPISTPFRQYTRLTVSVDSLVQCSALNSGNSVLKTYDLVAVRPLNQATFESACTSAEVDLIAIDFTGSLPFQIKFPSLQSALERGIFFEITYSPLIMDVHIRKQVVDTTKLLVQWTRGKNLIFTSAAASVCEIRGPCDVANLSSVLGISMECAKAAISKNCRSLLCNASRKKQYHKNVIAVENISSTKLLDSTEAWFYEGNEWDHISSGEGDLLLDDIAKSFAASSTVHKTSKAIDSISNEMPSKGTKAKDCSRNSSGKMRPPQDLSAAKGFGRSSDSNQVLEQYTKSGLDSTSTANGLSLASTPIQHQPSGCQEFSKSLSGNDISAIFTDNKEMGVHAISFPEGKGSDGAVSVEGDMVSHDEASKACGLKCALIIPNKDIQVSDPHAVTTESSELSMISSSLVHTSTNENDLMDTIDTYRHSTPTKEMASPSLCIEGDIGVNDLDVMASAHDAMMAVLSEKEESENNDLVLDGCDLSMKIDYGSGEKYGQCNDNAVPHAVVKTLGESSEMPIDSSSLAEFMREGASVKPDDRRRFKSGKSRFIHRFSLGGFQFSLKHLLHSKVFKKKSHKRKTRKARLRNKKRKG